MFFYLLFIYDFEFDIDLGDNDVVSRNKKVFIFWSPEGASRANKMAASCYKDVSITPDVKF